MPTLICGSLAFDTIMVFADRFANHILPEKIHLLNVCFLVPELRREYGGTAGNIAYNLQLLGGKPQIMATVGNDFTDYAAWLSQNGIDDTHIRTIAGSHTAQAFITTDLADNQIIAFHPGAMNYAHDNSVLDAKDISLAIISPDGREAMFQHARECIAAGIPYLFDPGQGLPMFTGDELMEFIEGADYLAVNDYEAQLLQEKTGHSIETLATRVDALVVTLGAKGSIIYTDGKRIEISSVQAEKIVDPTGCGDAYRAGLLYGIAQQWDWKRSGQLASVMGSIKVASNGAQNHSPSKQEIAGLYLQAYGEMVTL